MVRQIRRSLDTSFNSGKDQVTPTSLPSSWPGVQLLQSILTSANKEGAASLKILLCETAVAVYLSLLVSAASRFQPNQLYRLVHNCLCGEVWGCVFGGGTKIFFSVDESERKSSDPSVVHRDAARMKWNFRLLGKKATMLTATAGKFVQQELFIPPQMTLYDYFLRKVRT